MQNFRTTFQIPPSTNKISLNSQTLTVGSCFADVVGNQLRNNKLDVLVNPFGTLFNPLSIFKVISPSYTQADERLYVENQKIWLHYDLHSQFISNLKDNLEAQINQTLYAINSLLPTTNHLIITFGTAFIYRLLDPQTYVANCHKMPNICKGFAILHKELKEINPDLKIILTVSPVRHTKDGIPENQVSKSILRAACHYLNTDYENVEYFPSYEIMIDDLRDYRFYKPDLIHPNEVAEQYIFEKFAETYFDEELKNFIKEWTSIQTSLNHRPFNEKSENHQVFLKKLLEDLMKISGRVDVREEVNFVRQKIV
jgi:lysophospholipase L1-like esterase